MYVVRAQLLFITVYRYRDAGREVAAVLCEFSKCVEKASIDEAYIDITDIVDQRSVDNIAVTAGQLMNTFVVGFTHQHNNDEGNVPKYLQLSVTRKYIFLVKNIKRNKSLSYFIMQFISGKM